MKKIKYYLFFLLFVPLISSAQAITSQSYFSGTFSPKAEMHEVTNNASGVGTASCVLTQDGLWFFVTINGLTGNITGAHFHRAEIGKEGPIVKDITSSFNGMSARGLWTKNDAQPLTDSLIKDLILGKLYINVHTAQNPDGEARAQLILTSGVGLMAILSPAQEDSNVTSSAVGTGVFTLTEQGLKFEVTINNLTSSLTAAHFHRAPIGVSGSPVRTLKTDEIVDNTAKGVWSFTDAVEPLTLDLMRDLLDGMIYINFHTSNYPDGELRGQLMLSGGWSFLSKMDSSQMSNPMNMNAMGLGIYTLTPMGLVYNMTLNGLTGISNNAGFYSGSSMGSGNLVRTFTSDLTNNSVTGYWGFTGNQAITTDIMRNLFNQNLYTNFGTTVNPTGELRGQLMYMPGTNFLVYLSGPQAGQNINTQGGGLGYFTLNDTALLYNLQFNGLTGNITGANVYTGMWGMNGDSLFDIYSAFNGGYNGYGTYALSKNDMLRRELFIRQLMMNNTYLGIQTALYPQNELRGQIMPATGTGLKAGMSPFQEGHVVNIVDSNARGTATFILTDAGLAYNITMNGLSGPITEAHFHRGEIGVDGPVVKPITPDVNGNSISGFWSINDNDALTQGMINDLLTGKLYVNVHTALNPSGEMRGQIFLNGGFSFISRMTGTEVVPSVNSNATGTGVFTLTPAGLVYNVTLAGFSGSIASATIGNASFGQTGPTVGTFTPSFQNYTASGVWRNTDTQPFNVNMINNLFNRTLYFTIGTQANPGGEIRGQISTGEFITAVNDQPSIDETFSTESYPNPFSDITNISYNLTQAVPVDIVVTNSLGLQVMRLSDNSVQDTGAHSVEFNSAGLSSGVYYCTLKAGSSVKTIKLTVIK